MKSFTSIFRNGRRRFVAASLRKRPARSFASTFAALEGRALLSVVGTALASTSTTLTATLTSSATLTIAGPIAPNTATTYTTTTMALVASTSAGSATSSPSPRNPNSPGRGNPSGPGGSNDDNDNQHPSPPSSSSGDHVAMDLTRVDVDGDTLPEFALADFNRNEVFVRLGGPDAPAVMLGPSQGINHPESVTLADLNGDGIPDLIVANTNGNNILIFPGLGDGQFGAEENGGQGIAVGADPISVTVNYIENNPDQPQLIVTNAESNSVSILDGQIIAGAWVTTSFSSIATPSLPVKTLLYDVNGDGDPDLLVCNSGSNDVTMYSSLGNGAFDPNPVATFAVGLDPEAMFVGPFDRRDQADLVTVNAGSDDLTYIGDVFGPQPVTQTISSGGTSPDAAFAFDPGHTGVMDLVVANGGDGHLSLLQGGGDGLQLAGVITQAAIASPTALAPGSSIGDGFEFFAAGSGNDAAQLLSFDLGIVSAYLPATTGGTAALVQADGDLVAELMPFGESSMEMVAVLWAGGVESVSAGEEWTFRDPSSLTALYSPTEGQGVEDTPTSPEVPKEPDAPLVAPVAPSKVDDAFCIRFILGLDEALERPRGLVDAVAARDLDGALDRPVEGIARLDHDLDLDQGLAIDRRRVDRLPDAEAASGAVDEALRLFWSEGQTPGRESSAPSGSTPMTNPALSPTPDGTEAPATEVRLEAVPLISAVLLASTRLILKASPPRPSAFRRKPGLGFVSLKHDRKRPDPL